MKKKGLVIAASVMLVLCLAVGGTLAWLMDNSGPVTNTFTYGKVDIELTETTGTEYKMVPGNTIKKDPFATVVKDSEACWLVVKVKETEKVTKKCYRILKIPLECPENVDILWKSRIKRRKPGK